ncbi:glycosyltransferase family 4 protein [Mucisphaera calidilacus]|uniref:GDP-mannose-dependent alpha-(1-6)-phosphatidylinositol monomannoside mannosyltransferase n=1 Tax=Mucisphaera calidilacus TaxID=2527982 RepID=A0A518BXV3_9BACT|nr:glycosyltransferase family 4 protein [Mucisphaera calidilacus]QDU71802.1 GDP-mannose-dependent alpha-(1-6)-phosphatidylinositol monomannoside mannosyltransferase [Mucisphaera calidilacus]
MRIGYLLPSSISLSGPGNGIRAEVLFRAEALQKQGHDIVRVEPWDLTNLEELDVLHFMVGGFGTHGIENRPSYPAKFLVWGPIIDTNEPMWRYRLAAAAGSLLPKFFTIPGVFRAQAQAADLVIVRSTHEHQRVTAGLGIDPAKVEIVLGGVNPPPPVDPDLVRQRFDLPDEFALHVSKFTQGRKNVLNLIEAILPTKIPLVIAGSRTPGPVLDRIEQLAKEHPDQIKILGFLQREELDALYAACRIFCLPSTHEGIGLVALEAAALGAGVVITRHGGPPDYFTDLARYTSPGNVDEIRNAIQQAWDDPRGEQLRDHVLTNLTWDQHATNIADTYAKHRSRLGL